MRKEGTIFCVNVLLMIFLELFQSAAGGWIEAAHDLDGFFSLRDPDREEVKSTDGVHPSGKDHRDSVLVTKWYVPIA